MFFLSLNFMVEPDQRRAPGKMKKSLTSIVQDLSVLYWRRTSRNNMHIIEIDLQQSRRGIRRPVSSASRADWTKN
jgi:hypothetical protein